MAPPKPSKKTARGRRVQLAREEGSKVSEKLHHAARTKTNYSGNAKRVSEFLVRQIEQGVLAEQCKDAFQGVNACTPSALYLYVFHSLHLFVLSTERERKHLEKGASEGMATSTVRKKEAGKNRKRKRMKKTWLLYSKNEENNRCTLFFSLFSPNQVVFLDSHELLRLDQIDLSLNKPQ